MQEVIAISWFLWSIVTPGGSHTDSDIRAQPVKEFKSEAACQQALPLYQKEVDKAFPWPKLKPGTGMLVTWPTAILKCSPIYPR